MAIVCDQRDLNRYANARRARDARFDGEFFTAVKTTGIYCRPICPATPPLEKNIEYHDSAISAAHAGFRPCLRCRPDSAPRSCAWLGTEATFQRALVLIQQGALQTGSIEQLAARLGISDRYLRQLFQRNLGTSPKKYAIYQQCLFAKKLLHESGFTITDIAYASGFNSVRRFNEAMKQQVGLAPRDIRKCDKTVSDALQLTVCFRPPYARQAMFKFLHDRAIDGMEWVTNNSYSRTIRYRDSKGFFTIDSKPDNNHFDLNIHLDDYRHLNAVTQRIKVLFDVDAPIARIDHQLGGEIGRLVNYCPGLRVPGIWSTFEAGIRAILGQQVLVSAARKLVLEMVQNLGEPAKFEGMPARYFFPEPKAVMDSKLDFFRMPQSRKDALHRLAEHYLTADDPDNVDAWLAIKGIGPWTINYVKLRALKDPDVWLAGDAGLKNAAKILGAAPDLERTRPWRSYLTLQMWNQL